MILLIAFWFGSSAALAEISDNVDSALTLHFEQPERFTDLRAAGESQVRFQSRTLAGFQRILVELAAELPVGYSWQVTVTDIDLAGEVNAIGGSEAIRMVHPSYPPRISFNHQLLDEQGQTILSGGETLQDLSFMQRPPRPAQRHHGLQHEYTLLKRWFERQVMPQIESSVGGQP
jgi:hypothetical protein